MDELEAIKAKFAQKLDQKQQQSETRLEADLQELRTRLLREFKPDLPPDLEDRSRRLTQTWPVASPQPLVDISHSNPLQELDEVFIRSFNLAAWFPVDKLRYPTVYCETLEEFCVPLVEQYDISPEARRIELDNMMQQAEETAKKFGGGIFGYNLPGKGAYLNGWLFAFRSELTPRQVYDDPAFARVILGTAAHEKLGHGFLAVYSALGQVKTRLGLDQDELTRKFGLRTADDPTSSLRRGQANLLFMVSQLLEEGWATWIENSLAASYNSGSPQPRHKLKAVMQAIDNLPDEIPDRQELVDVLKTALLILFDPQQEPDLGDLHQAVMILEMMGGQLDDFFGSQLGQPLRYAVGELVFVQAEHNLGAACQPYAALIAANVSFDPAKVGLTDLRELFGRDARLNPDLRMAALSRMQLAKKGDVATLARQANAIFSFSIPQELK